MTMREKIARAACEAGHHASWPEGTSYTNRDEQRAWFKIADAVLDALMEPTEGMVKAGVDADEQLEWAASDAAVPEVFKAMIKAAQEGK
jgi:hypothetical protein